MTTIKSSILNRYINTLQTFVNSFSDDITDEIAKEKGLIIKKKISSLNAKEKADLQALIAVSYTHLTLPTILRV